MSLALRPGVLAVYQAYGRMMNTLVAAHWVRWYVPPYLHPRPYRRSI